MLRVFMLLRLRGRAWAKAVTTADAAAPPVQVTAPAAGHAKFGATQMSATEGLHDSFDFAAKVGDYTDAKALKDA
jgi:hypothetical protein